MNVFGKLIIWLLSTGFIGGVILTSTAILVLWLIVKLRSKENGDK